MPEAALHALLIAVAYAIPGCSLVLDFDSRQCATDADCRRMGAAQCSNGACVFAALVSGTSELEGSESGSAGSNSGASGLGATGAGENVTEGMSESAGSAHGCTSAKQCSAGRSDEPHICPTVGADCLSLTTPEFD
ncbi:hypothetical protein ACFL5O_02125 [Myxococcota bacterium]